jgi:hypothetical protein
MRVVFEMLCGIALALIVGNNAFAKEWRGIIPLHSTRADVEKLLGPPPNDEAALYQPSDNRSIHNLDEEVVTIFYLARSNPANAIRPGTRIK